MSDTPVVAFTPAEEAVIAAAVAKAQAAALTALGPVEKLVLSVASKFDALEAKVAAFVAKHSFILGVAVGAVGAGTLATIAAALHK